MGGERVAIALRRLRLLAECRCLALSSLARVLPQTWKVKNHYNQIVHSSLTMFYSVEYRRNALITH